jgi:hypothetical protein
MKYNNKNWYSIIISVLLIGFLLMLTTWVFNLVLKEHHDNKGLWDSIKAFAWAESAQELALLKIKEKWYWIDHKVEHEVSTGSIILSEDTLDVTTFNQNKDTFISYDLNVLAELVWTQHTYWDILTPNQYSIIPLFYERQGEAIEFVRSYDLNISSWFASDLVWNLVSWSGWIWNNAADSMNQGNWKNITLNLVTWIPEAEHVSNQDRIDFLNTRNNAYLILFNWWNADITFRIKSDDKFSKPKTTILSSAQIWKYKHNLETKYDNTQFLNMLKYAVFSN